MKKLSELLERISYTCVQGTLDAEVQEIVNDSRKASEGSLFFCIPQIPGRSRRASSPNCYLVPGAMSNIHLLFTGVQTPFMSVLQRGKQI